MMLESQPNPEAAQVQRKRLLYLRVAIVVLLIAIAGLVTLAKNTQYSHSHSNHVHYLNIASKMRVAPAPAILNQTPLRLAARFVAPLYKVRASHVCEMEVIEVPSLSVTLNLQHRSPPPFVS
jgi:hypothetical protein